MSKLYLAGSLFNEAEVAQRKLEGRLLRERFGQKLEIFNPIDQPFNTNKESLPTPVDVFKGDYEAVKSADVVIADLTNNDPGVMAELGIAYENHAFIIGIDSDIRLMSANKYEIPTYGMNHFILGLIQSRDGVLATSFAQAMDELDKYLEASL